MTNTPPADAAREASAPSAAASAAPAAAPAPGVAPGQQLGLPRPPGSPCLVVDAGSGSAEHKVRPSEATTTADQQSSRRTSDSSGENGDSGVLQLPGGSTKTARGSWSNSNFAVRLSPSTFFRVSVLGRRRSQDLVGDQPPEYPWSREELLIAGVYVTCYAIVTRLPMIFAVVHMRVAYAFNAGWCAVFFCAYCVGRMLAAYMVQLLFSMRTMVAATTAGLAGYAVVLIFERERWVFGAMCFVLGIAETVTGFDVILKKECQLRKFPPKRQIMTFRLCMIMTTIGSGTAYCLGGFLYQEYGSRSVCLLGIASAVVQLAALLVYGIWRRSFIAGGWDVGEEIVKKASSGKAQKVTTHDSTKEKRKLQTLEARKNLAWQPSTREQDEAAEKHRMMLTVVGSMYITPMAVGTNFATLAYFWLSVWNIGTGTSGTLMAVGECLGVVTLLFFQRPRIFHSPLTFPFGSPINVCLTSVVIGLCCFAVVVPNIVICAIGSVGVHMFNACIHSFCNELCAIACPKGKFAEWQGRAYLAKRSSNCSMGFVQTILFAIAPQCPHAAAGSIMLLWGGVLATFYVAKGLSPLQVRAQQARINSVLGRMGGLGTDGFVVPPSSGGRWSLASLGRSSMASSMGGSRTTVTAVVPTQQGRPGGGHRRGSLRDTVEGQRASLGALSPTAEAELGAALPKRGSIQDIMLERLFQQSREAEDVDGGGGKGDDMDGDSDSGFGDEEDDQEPGRAQAESDNVRRQSAVLLGGDF